MFTNCPHCRKAIVIHLEAVAEHPDEAQKLLNEWLGYGRWGQMQLEWMTAKIAQYGYERTEKAAKECISRQIRNWQYLDKVLEGSDRKPEDNKPKIEFLSRPEDEEDRQKKDFDNWKNNGALF